MKCRWEFLLTHVAESRHLSLTLLSYLRWWYCTDLEDTHQGSPWSMGPCLKETRHGLEMGLAQFKHFHRAPFSSRHRMSKAKPQVWKNSQNSRSARSFSTTIKQEVFIFSGVENSIYNHSPLARWEAQYNSSVQEAPGPEGHWETSEKLL